LSYFPVCHSTHCDDDDDDDDAGGVYIMSGPRNVTVSDGGTARLHCDVDGFPPDNISVDWIYEAADVVASTSPGAPVDDTRRRFTVDAHTASLTVVNVSTLDAGSYTCAAYSGLGASAAAVAYLNVTCMSLTFVIRRVAVQYYYC